jgi:hypothetical protein
MPSGLVLLCSSVSLFVKQSLYFPSTRRSLVSRTVVRGVGDDPLHVLHHELLVGALRVLDAHDDAICGRVVLETCEGRMEDPAEIRRWRKYLILRHYVLRVIFLPFYRVCWSILHKTELLVVVQPK